MPLSIEHALAALAGVSALVVLAKTADRLSRILAVVLVLACLGTALGPTLSGQGWRVDLAAVSWIVAAILGLLVAWRCGRPALAALIIAGSLLGCLLELGVLAR
ncbi:MAG: hypothetical protein RMM29_06735 [Planctomycetota bacterium]|nr:hypothetical protein [Planctomycetota bacterium]MCX8039399.1 hypothetical protein [Planctomycetota bacterium]MDW8373325.1 hypothetical protein [Planctomycetota bacterium]